MCYERIGNVWGDVGANWVYFGSKFGTPKIALNYDRIIRVFRIYAYFTVLNVPNDRMTHPWPEAYACRAHSSYICMYRMYRTSPYSPRCPNFRNIKGNPGNPRPCK